MFRKQKEETSNQPPRGAELGRHLAHNIECAKYLGGKMYIFKDSKHSIHKFKFKGYVCTVVKLKFRVEILICS